MSFNNDCADGKKIPNHRVSHQFEMCVEDLAASVQLIIFKQLSELTALNIGILLVKVGLKLTVMKVGIGHSRTRSIASHRIVHHFSFYLFVTIN